MNHATHNSEKLHRHFQSDPTLEMYAKKILDLTKKSYIVKIKVKEDHSVEIIRSNDDQIKFLEERRDEYIKEVYGV
jgi:hypothetical protein